jgi:tetratricopeptide (TPR) repeat protein
MNALSASPNDEKAMLGMAHAYFSRAVALGLMNRDPLSEYWQKSLNIYASLIARGSRDPSLDRDYSRSLTFYSSRLLAAGKKGEALDALERSHDLNERRLAAAPGDQDAATDLVMSRHMLGEALNEIGRPEEALASLENALALVERLSRASPEDMYLRDRVAWSHAALGDQLMGMKRFPNALANYRETIRIYEDFKQNRPGAGFSRPVFAETWLNMGKVEQQLGRRSAACTAFTQATKVYADINMGEARKKVRDLAAKAKESAAACGSAGVH